MYEIYPKLKKETERRHSRHSSVFDANVQQISYTALVKK